MGKYDHEVISRLKKLRDNGTAITWHTAVAVAKSIVEIKDPYNQHRYVVAEPWARSLVQKNEVYSTCCHYRKAHYAGVSDIRGETLVYWRNQ